MTLNQTLGALAVALSAACLWQLASASSDYQREKNQAQAAHQRCLSNFEQQAGQLTSGVWPCWHSQLALRNVQSHQALLAAFTPSSRLQAALYLATLAVLMGLLVDRLKQRQSHTNQTDQRTDPNQ